MYVCMYVLTATDRKPQKSKSNVNHTNIDIQAQLVWLTLLFMIFAVFDPSPLTVCINCSFYFFCSNAHKANRMKICLSVCVCLSVCLSHAGIVSNRLNVRSRKCLAILVQYQRVTDRCDGQTDGLTHDDSMYCVSIASRVKNGHVTLTISFLDGLSYR